MTRQPGPNTWSPFHQLSTPLHIPDHRLSATYDDTIVPQITYPVRMGDNTIRT